ncbi:hypothetical protein ACFLUW_02665, partial [Chloroflexota bacterium]
QGGTKQYHLKLNHQQEGIRNYLSLLSGTNLLYLLIRVSQVRDLYGLPRLEDLPCRGDLTKIQARDSARRIIKLIRLGTG